jgi:hypothetical protein
MENFLYFWASESWRMDCISYQFAASQIQYLCCDKIYDLFEPFTFVVSMDLNFLSKRCEWTLKKKNKTEGHIALLNHRGTRRYNPNMWPKGRNKNIGQAIPTAYQSFCFTKDSACFSEISCYCLLLGEVLQFELSLVLARQAIYHLSHTSSPSAYFSHWQNTPFCNETSPKVPVNYSIKHEVLGYPGDAH